MPTMLDTIAFAAMKHATAPVVKNRVRKYTGLPYIVHPLAVAKILQDFHMPLHVQQAAVLHDVLEDTDCTFDEMLKYFGGGITQLVVEVTEVSKPEDGNRAIRKEIDRQHFANSSYYGAAIKLADLTDNTDDISLHDPNFAVVYMKEKESLLNVLMHGPVDLYDHAVASLQRARNTLSASSMTR